MRRCASLVPAAVLALSCAAPAPHHRAQPEILESDSTPDGAPARDALGREAAPAADASRPSLVTPEDDRRVGAQQAQAAALQYGLVDDPKLAAYVDTVGQRVAANAPGGFRYHFQIVSEDVPNAFALPGGYVFVTRGLLVLVNSEDELANVLGHEISHVALRHAAAQESVESSPVFSQSTLVRDAGAGVDVAGGQLGESRTAWLARYGRDEESDADRLGQRLAAAAGFDPARMGEFLRDLENETRLTSGGPRMPGFLDSHPATPDRLTAAALAGSTLRATPRPAVAAGRAGFLAELDGLVVGADPSEGVLVGTRFVQPALGFTLEFPEGFEVENQHAAVVALSPERDLEILLETQGAGSDPHAAADAFFAKPPPGAKLERQGGAALTVPAGPAWRETARITATRGVLDADVTWIAVDGTIYRILAVGPAVNLAARRDAIAAVPRSFRRTGPATEDGIRVLRLRSAAAQGSESLEAFSARTGNAWKLPELAVANDLFVDATLEDGQLLKIVREESWSGPRP